MESQHKILLLIGVFLWYMSSIMVNVHWKSTFNSYRLSKSTTNQHYKYAMFFTAVQFAAGAVTSFLLIVCFGKMNNLSYVLTWWRKGVVIGCLFYFGQLSTNMSLTMNSVTLTHMVKTLEPLLALLWALSILKNNISCASVVYIQIMVVGVLLTCYSEVTFNLTGVIFALVSNVSLSLRNLFIILSNKNEMITKLQLSNKNEKLIGINLFFVSCLFGFLYSSSEYLLYLFINQSSINNDYSLFSIENIQMGIYFSGQHIMSYLLLHYINITSHALMNCLKRALMILVSAIILGVKLPTINIFGIIITFISSIFYVFEVKKTSDGKSEGTITKYIHYTFLIPYKLILLLSVILLLSLAVTGKDSRNGHVTGFKYWHQQIGNNHFTSNKSLPLDSGNVDITAVWAFDAPITMQSLELVNCRLEAHMTNLKVFCYNVAKCKESAIKFTSKTMSIQIIQLKAFELSKNTPAAAWMASHPINKIKSLTCFPAYFHKMMYLSALWKYGGIVIDMALSIKENSDIKDFMISSSIEGCLLDTSKSSVIICNLHPGHNYTEILIEELTKLFMKNPKSCTFNSYFQNVYRLTNTAVRGVVYNIPSPEKMFGLLAYETTHNLGDEMQSIAAAHILPYISAFISRQTFNNPDGNSMTYIGNAWWNVNGILFKNISKLITVPVSVHIIPPAYEKLKSSKSLLKAMGPIGARDSKTYEILTKNDIESYFTGCLTLWMKNPNVFTNLKRNNETIVVDVIMKQNLIPETITNIKHISHRWGNGKSNKQIQHFTQEERYINVYEFLMQYAQAKVVITSRIHVALPCVAIGTPVVFFNSKDIFGSGKNPTPRVAGLLDLFHTVDMYSMNETSAKEYFKTFNWDSPTPNPNTKKVEVLKREARKILERIPELAMSLKVLELI